MKQVVDAAVRFPTVTLTSALVVVLGFWLLVLLGRADVRAFDADAPSLTRSLRGMPVAVAASAMIVSAWFVSLAGTVLMDLAHLTGPGSAAARVALLAVCTLVAWLVTRRYAASRARRFPVRSGPHRRVAVSGTPYDPGSPRARG
nr:hypothetical protein OH837_38930 [Streptomyces canus]